jgi:hypothetical protein
MITKYEKSHQLSAFQLSEGSREQACRQSDVRAWHCHALTEMLIATNPISFGFIPFSATIFFYVNLKLVIASN